MNVKYVLGLSVVLVFLASSSLEMLQPFMQDNLYSSRKIKQLAEALPVTNLPNRDTMMVIPTLISNKAVAFNYNEKKELCHVGLSLFSHETKDLLDNNICNFLERFILELLLQNDKKGVCFKLEEYHVSLFINGKDYSLCRGLCPLKETMKAMEMPVNFGISHAGGRAKATWIFNNHTLMLDFPLYRELIEGTDKKESDDVLYNRLQGAAFKKIERKEETITPDLLEYIHDGIYVMRGEKFVIKHLSADRYYMKQGEVIVPVFHKEYPTYSLNNLFQMMSYDKDVSLLLTHRKYGHFTPEVSIPLLNFLDFFQKDFILTSHTSFKKNGELESILVFSHKTLGYIHILRVRTTEQELFSQNLVLKGDFYSNIPQHYVKTLLK